MLQFRYDTSERFEKQLTAYIKTLKPEATVDYNYHGSPPFSFEVGQTPRAARRQCRLRHR